MIPLYSDENDKQPYWFEDGKAYIQHRFKETRPHYLTTLAALEVCNLATEYNLYIKWYEGGILHEKDGAKSYEPRDSWINSYAGIHSVKSIEEARNNNLAALMVIKEDIDEGYTAFSIQLEKIADEL